MYDGEYRTTDTGVNPSGERSATSDCCRVGSVATRSQWRRLAKQRSNDNQSRRQSKKRDAGFVRTRHSAFG